MITNRVLGCVSGLLDPLTKSTSLSSLEKNFIEGVNQVGYYRVCEASWCAELIRWSVVFGRST